MDDSKRKELLEIYRLHADLADKVSQRREDANRLYVSLLVGLGVFVAALLRFGNGDGYDQPSSSPQALSVLCYLFRGMSSSAPTDNLIRENS